MTWKEFFSTIEKSNLLNNTPASQIVIKLFLAAGRESDITESAAKSWIAATRNCKATHYFKSSELNDIQGAINFFRRRPEKKIRQLQQLFRKVAAEDSPIDLTTDNMDIFCRSLVNQFIDLLGFERLDMPDSKPSSISNESTDKNQMSHKAETLQDRITNSDSLAHEDIETEITSQKDSCSSCEAQINIPSECKACLYCKNWYGNVKDASKSTVGIYGKCLLFHKEILSSNTNICTMFNPAYERISPFSFNKTLAFLNNMKNK